MGPAQPANTSNSPSSPFVSILVPTSPKATSATVIMSTIASNTPTSIEKLPANILQLEPDGSNWAIFIMCFQDAIKVTCRWLYFTRSNPKPKAKNPKSLIDTKIKAATQWEYQDSMASYLLSQHLLDTTVMRLNSHVTMEEWWTAVTKEYQAKSAYA